MVKTLYKEEQKFGQPWIWLIFIPLTASSLTFFAFGLHKQLVLGEPFGDKPMPDAGLLIVAIFTVLLMVGITLLFYKMKLVVEIRSDGVYFRYPPMINAFRRIGNDEIQRFEVREYKPIREFGGWGIKTGTSNYGKAYNTKGNIGLQLYLKDGTKVLFGTQRRAAIHAAATNMMKATIN